MNEYYQTIKRPCSNCGKFKPLKQLRAEKMYSASNFIICRNCRKGKISKAKPLKRRSRRSPYFVEEITSKLEILEWLNKNIIFYGEEREHGVVRSNWGNNDSGVDVGATISYGSYLIKRKINRIVDFKWKQEKNLKMKIND